MFGSSPASTVCPIGTTRSASACGQTLGSRVLCCDNLAFSGEVTMHRKHTVNVFRDLPDLMYRMLADVSSMKAKLTEEIERMKAAALTAERADHLMILGIRGGALPASRLPKVIEAWEEPRHVEFVSRMAWSLFNATRKSPRPHRRARRWRVACGSRRSSAAASTSPAFSLSLSQ